MNARTIARALVPALSLTLFGLAGPAAAAEIDAYNSPVFGNGRVLGMAGAYTSVAEGSEGMFSNPAALSNRTKRGELGLKLYFSLDLSLDNVDVTPDTVDMDGDGTVASVDALRGGTTSLGFMISKFGLGLVAEGASARYKNSIQPYEGTLSRWSLPASFAAADGMMIFGAGPVMHTYSLEGTADGVAKAKYRGWGIDMGFLWRPTDLPARLGFRALTPATGSADGGDKSVVPGKAHFPWQVALGMSLAWKFDGRSYNFKFAEEEEEEADQRYFLVSGEAVVVGSTKDGVSTEGFLTQADPSRAGKNIGVSLRLGLESEILDDRLKLRVGTYSEADRVGGKAIGRVHGTGGADLRLIWIIKVGASADFAENYQNIQFGLGAW